MIYAWQLTDGKLIENEGKVRVFVAHDIQLSLCVKKLIKFNTKVEQEVQFFCE